jgi:hypothetical protein
LRGLASTLEGQATQTVTDVGVRASREAVTRLEADHVVAYVDVAGLGPGLYSLSVHADSPPMWGLPASNPRRPGSAYPVAETERLFGTDGVRGNAGRYPLDRPTVRRSALRCTRLDGIRDS